MKVEYEVAQCAAIGVVGMFVVPDEPLVGFVIAASSWFVVGTIKRSSKKRDKDGTT